jgi:hypothetical protein
MIYESYLFFAFADYFVKFHSVNFATFIETSLQLIDTMKASWQYQQAG